jgi:hypothetical protein
VRNSQKQAALAVNIAYAKEVNRWPKAVREAIASDAIQAPKLDGRLDDACWQKIDSFASGFTAPGNGDSPDFQTYFKTCHDRDTLYFGLFLPDDQKAQKLSDYPAGKLIWANNAVEIFLQPPTAENVFYHFAADYWGKKILLKGSRDKYRLLGEKTQSSDTMRSASFSDAKGWYLEVAIPLEILGLKSAPSSGAAWKLNVCRNKPQSPVSSWATLDKRFAEPWNFGTLFWDRSASLATEYLSLGQVSENDSIFIADIRNPGDTSVPLTMRVDVDGKTVARARRTIAPGVNTYFMPFSQTRKPVTATLMAFTDDGRNLQLGQAVVAAPAKAILIMPGVNDKQAETKSGTSAYTIMSVPETILSGNPVPCTFNLPFDQNFLAEQQFRIKAIRKGETPKSSAWFTLKYAKGSLSVNADSWRPGLYELVLQNRKGFNVSRQLTIVKDELE